MNRFVISSRYLQVQMLDQPALLMGLLQSVGTLYMLVPAGGHMISLSVLS